MTEQSNNYKVGSDIVLELTSKTKHCNSMMLKDAG